MYLKPDTTLNKSTEESSVKITIKMRPTNPKPIMILGIPIGKHCTTNMYIKPETRARIVTTFKASRRE